MNSRPMLFLLSLACLAPAAAAQAQTPLPASVQAQTLPTLTFTHDGSGAGTLNGQAVTYQAYLFDITGFSNVGPDPNNAYTIYSFSNTSIQSSPNFLQITPYDLPTGSDGWSFSNSPDFTISTSATKGIHATDPTFGLIIYQKAGTPTISPYDAPFTLYHQINGVDPFLNSNGTPLTINAVPEASSVVSLGLLLTAGLGCCAFRRRRVA